MSYLTEEKADFHFGGRRRNSKDSKDLPEPALLAQEEAKVPGYCEWYEIQLKRSCNIQCIMEKYMYVPRCSLIFRKISTYHSLWTICYQEIT